MFFVIATACGGSQPPAVAGSAPPSSIATPAISSIPRTSSTPSTASTPRALSEATFSLQLDAALAPDDAFGVELHLRSQTVGQTSFQLCGRMPSAPSPPCVSGQAYIHRFGGMTGLGLWQFRRFIHYGSAQMTTETIAAGVVNFDHPVAIATTYRIPSALTFPFTDSDLGYTIDVPTPWFAFGQLGPGADAFSNEQNGSAPLALSPGGVSLTVSRGDAACPPQPTPGGGDVIRVEGQDVVLTAPVSFAAPGGEGGGGSRSYLNLQGRCYYAAFQSQKPDALTTNHRALVGIVQSFRPS